MREPGHGTGHGGERHQGPERDRHDRGIGEEHLVVDVHPVPELEHLGPPADECAAVIGRLRIIEGRGDQDDHGPEEPEEMTREPTIVAASRCGVEL